MRHAVILPAHDPARFHELSAAVAAVRTQNPDQIVVAVDHSPELLELARRELDAVTVVPNRFGRGVSGTRNSGAQATDADLLVFLDSDTVPQPGWLAELTAAFADPGVVGAGGGIDPLWERRPAWVPDEFLWAYGASHPGLPDTPSRVRNVWSANMAVRADAFAAVGGFRTDFGKVGSRSRPEDTELCLRVARHSGGAWLYVPQARVYHRVPGRYGTLRYFLIRCYNEGRGKIAMRRLVPGRQTLGPERSYLRSLPRAVGRGLVDAVSGRDRQGVRRAGAVLAGLAAAGAGAVVELSAGVVA
jgi:GT2 family glycosyltransferase